MSGPAGGISTACCKGLGISARPAPNSPTLTPTARASLPPWRAACRSRGRYWGRASSSSRRGRSYGRRSPSGKKMTGLAMSRSATRGGRAGDSGCRPKWRIAIAGRQVWQPYLRANLWRDWGADANTVFSGKDVVPLESQANVLEFGGGLTVRINANVSVYANADYEFAVGNTDDNKRSGVRGALGARYSW